jgi:hypothetical protein
VTASVTHTIVSGFDAVVIENEHLRAVIIPSLGARVWELVDKARDRQWIWHRQGVPLAANARGASYDDVWAGGWEELFPNDAAGEFEGRDLPDHGIWWTTSWTVEESTGGAEAVVRLVATTRAPDCALVKEFRVGGDSDTVSVSYEIESRETKPFHFLFKQHLPIALTPSCELALPGGRVTPVDPAFGRALTTATPFDWPEYKPAGGAPVDLRTVPPPSPDGREFVYVDHLPDSWCGVDDVDAGASLRMRYDGAQLPFVWLFLTYGGWRDCYTAVLEPCTNMPKDLATALRLGQSARLSPGEVFQTRVDVTLRERSSPSPNV